MKILKIIGIIVAVLVAVVVIIGLTGEKAYDIKRDAVINASASKVFHAISHYSEFPKWSPWQELDPNMKTNLEGTDGTVGAKYSWEGNDKAGSGSMTITKLEDGKYLEQALEFLKPFKSSSTTYFSLEEADGGTKVTWGMRGESDFMSRVFLTLMGGMDKAVGSDYEKGLAQLKAFCEAAPVYEVKEIDWAEKNCLAFRKVVGFADLSNFFGEHYGKMYEAITKSGATPGIPLGVYYDYDEAGMKTDVAAAIPYEGKTVTLKGYNNLSLPATKGYSIDYYGPYGDEMKKPYEAMDAKLKELGKTNPTMVIEEYITDPAGEPDSTKWHTKIFFFVAP
ncbi:MAG: SRPBCC family protein [Chitinophagales bacterium]|nr:SRPBCC family protein [Chitinophagales bacterium]